MDDGVYVALDLDFSQGDRRGWQRAPLSPEHEALRGVGDFDRLDTSDDDLLGEGNALGPSATVADLLALVGREADEGQHYFSVVRDEDRVSVRGFLATWSDYREHRLPLVYAATAARAFGGRGALSLLGEVDGEIVTILVDVDGGDVRVELVDPQNLTEDDWNARLGSVSTLDAARKAWAKRARKARR